MPGPLGHRGPVLDGAISGGRDERPHYEVNSQTHRIGQGSPGHPKGCYDVVALRRLGFGANLIGSPGSEVSAESWFPLTCEFRGLE